MRRGGFPGASRRVPVSAAGRRAARGAIRERREAERDALRPAGLRRDRAGPRRERPPRAESNVKAPRVLVAAVQSPFSGGGAERHVRRLTEELADARRRGGPRHDSVDRARALRPRPLRARAGAPSTCRSSGTGPWTPSSRRAFRATPCGIPNKIVWVIHQYRQAYDQFGTPWSDFTASAEDRRTRETIAAIDRVGLSEARQVFANSKTVAARLARFNGIASEPLYHPPPLVGRYRTGPFGDYALTVGRLDGWKRPDLPLRALAHAPAARLAVVGRGPEEERLEEARPRARRRRPGALDPARRTRRSFSTSTRARGSSSSRPRARTSGTCRSRRFSRESRC